MAKIKGYKVRTKIKKSDNKKLLELEEKTPMKGYITMYYDHSPNFFRFYQLYGRVEPYIIEDDDKIIAFLGGAVIKASINNKPIKVLVGTNLKVHPDYQEQGIGYDLLRYAFNKSRKKHDAIITFNIESNTPVEKIHEKFPEFKFNPLNLYQFLPFKKYKKSSDYKIKRAGKKDIKELYKLIKDYYNNYFFSPHLNFKTFKKELKLPDYGFNKILVAEKDDKIVACLGLWDQSAVRKIVLIDIPLTLRLLKGFLKILKIFRKVPQIPSLGEELSVIHFKHLAYQTGHERALKDLIAEALDYCRLNNHLLAISGASPSDPINKVFQDFTNIRNKLHMGFYHKKKLDLTKPVYVDTSML